MSVAPFEWYPLTEGKNHTPSAAEWGIDRARGLLGGETQKERQLTELTPGATKPLLNRGSYAHAAVIKSDVFVSRLGWLLLPGRVVILVFFPFRGKPLSGKLPVSPGI